MLALYGDVALMLLLLLRPDLSNATRRGETVQVMRAVAVVQAVGMMCKNVSCPESATGIQDRSKDEPSDVVVVQVALEVGEVALPGSYDHRDRDWWRGSQGLARQLSA
jgi:hypothetical protein